MWEKIILNQFNTFLLDNKRLTSHQRGNRKVHSTETLSTQLTASVLEAMDKKQITALVLLNLSNAFDCIDHATLLHKLSIVGASPSIANWFKSYLSSRYQYVRIGSTHSDTANHPWGSSRSDFITTAILYLSEWSILSN